MNDIYTRLKNGESIDDIMNGFADEANAAQTRIAEEEAAAEAAEVARMKAYAEERARNEAKRQEMVELIDSTFGFCAKWYPELGLTSVEDWDDEDIKPIADLVLMLLDVELIKAGAKSKKAEVECTETVAPPIIEKVRKPNGNGFMMRAVPADDVFADFFKSLGLD